MTEDNVCLLYVNKTKVSVFEPHIQNTWNLHNFILRLTSGKTIHITCFLAKPSFAKWIMGTTIGCQPGSRSLLTN